MDFNNPKVRQRMYEHIRFAVTSVEAAFPSDSQVTLNSDDKIVEGMKGSVKVNLVGLVLSFTLGEDLQLKNTLRDLRREELSPESKRSYEDWML